MAALMTASELEMLSRNSYNALEGYNENSVCILTYVLFLSVSKWPSPIAITMLPLHGRDISLSLCC